MKKLEEPSPISSLSSSVNAANFSKTENKDEKWRLAGRDNVAACLGSFYSNEKQTHTLYKKLVTKFSDIKQPLIVLRDSGVRNFDREQKKWFISVTQRSTAGRQKLLVT